MNRRFSEIRGVYLVATNVRSRNSQYQFTQLTSSLYILVGFWSRIMAQILWKALLSENVRCSFMYKLFRGRLAAFSPIVFITFFFFLFSFFNNFYNNSFISFSKLKKNDFFCDWNEFFNQRSNIGQIREYYKKLQKHRY